MSIFYDDAVFQFEKPHDGDLLFRWLPKGLPRDTKKHTALTWLDRGQRSPIHKTIEKKQHIIFAEATDYFSNLQHVGIWCTGAVVEVGGKGISRNAVSERSNYDVVLRSPLFADRIAKKCTELHLPIAQTYPINDLNKLSKHPLETRGKIDDIWGQLLIQEGDVHEEDRNSPQQRVVCSHFVHAVLYAAAYPGGSIAVATMHEYDDRFKISPEELYRQYRTDKGGTVISKFRFVMAGMQHRGRLIPYRALYAVGWRSDEDLLPGWAKQNVIKLFHNELNDLHSVIEDAGNGVRTVTP